MKTGNANDRCRIPLCLLILAGVSGCASPGKNSTERGGAQTSESPSRSCTPEVGHIGGVSNDGTYFVAYLPKPNPIPLNDMFELTVWVSPASDHTECLTDINVQADAAMPEHDHGMNTNPRVAANPDGSFTVSGMLFHMPGHWQMYLDITRARITERSQFDIQLE